MELKKKLVISKKLGTKKYNIEIFTLNFFKTLLKTNVLILSYLFFYLCYLK